ncbi:hypothetical protein NQ314_000298 [Rhamnusium bicolor]|uniref:Peptidase aspartic putative domain-containing protein n=1 Tax=Rhamnusium bicolor TaxID=1586634 RepID=A0AAV8ZXN4_9CUCU|nr:hypothetical protein NQ314_000298 [Rhamnusium bicolor]
MAGSVELKKLHKRRGYLKGQLTRFTNFLSTCNDEANILLQLQARLDAIKTTFSEFNSVQVKIEYADEVSNSEMHLREREECETKYFEASPASRFIRAVVYSVSVYIYDTNNQKVQCRALLDNGSQSNFAISDLIRRLGLRTSKIDLPISGISQTVTRINRQANLQTWIEKEVIYYKKILLKPQKTKEEKRYAPKKPPSLPKDCEKHNSKAYKCNLLSLQDVRKFYQAFYSDRNKVSQDNFVLQYTMGETPKRGRQVKETSSRKGIAKDREQRVAKNHLVTGLGAKEMRGGDTRSKAFLPKRQEVKRFIEKFEVVDSHYAREYLLNNIDDDMAVNSESDGDSDADDNVPLGSVIPSSRSSRSSPQTSFQTTIENDIVEEMDLVYESQSAEPEDEPRPRTFNNSDDEEITSYCSFRR